MFFVYLSVCLFFFFLQGNIFLLRLTTPERKMTLLSLFHRLFLVLFVSPSFITCMELPWVTYGYQLMTEMCLK